MNAMPTGNATFIDCPPFLNELYQGDLREIVPDLVVKVGSPSREEAIALLADSTFALNDHTMMDAGFLEACPTLKVIVFLGLGAASFIDLEAADRLGIQVRAYGGYGDRSIAEHAIGLMFAAGRKIGAMDRALRAGTFEAQNGIEFAGKTLGVVGTGGIGKEVVRIGSALGMEVVAWSRSGVPADLPAKAVELDALLASADVVSLHLALNPETEGMIDKRRLGLMKRDALLVNTARGAIIDEAALIDALNAKKIAHAALDVFSDEPLAAGHPLTRLDNTTLTPHAAFMTGEASYRLLKMALDILAKAKVASP
ncbi:MAG: 2-hydroxyacid dehydrogenase [Geminicoccaceae bacterium]